ncbi:quinolinate synthase [candidate division GN15 bacterium]|uniref:Quinolinate synthase n=1 Tax=candidate division GN15 bacterium TaxID=2072418 RepID=A0A855X2W8_9BACT|nr:MAG: quinolinate synthase [candidate division GN15 bacterium]
MYFALPKEYRESSIESLRERVIEAKRKLCNRLCILVHHYQRLEVVEFADHIGDSYGLSKIAAGKKDADIIVFCGVHFMAESADILTGDHQNVYLPNPLAGCPMADMAEMADVLAAWESLQPYGGVEKIMPISYMNTAAGLKAFTGRNGGLICTSSNAASALRWALERREKAFFFPDQHLGYNTGIKFGLKPEEMVIWDFTRDDGGLTAEQIERARVILWKGHCHVHTNFTAEQIHEVRANYPGVKVVVHPECPPEVVQLADASGSTSFIVKFCAEAPSGSIIAIGTEINLINRMAHVHPDKKIFELSGMTCPVCANMYRTTLNDLAYTLERFEDIKPIRVNEPIRSEARLALDKMLEIA